MPFDPAQTIQKTPASVDVIDYQIIDSPAEESIIGTVSARLMASDGTEHSRPSGPIADNLGALPDADVRAWLDANAALTDAARAAALVAWLLGRNRTRITNELIPPP